MLPHDPTDLARIVFEESGEAARAGESWYRCLIDNLEQHIFLKDADGRFLAANPPFYRGLGCAREEELLGKTDEDFFPPDLAAKYRADDRKVLDEGKRLEVEEKNLTPGGMRTVRVVKTPLRDGDGRLVGVLGIFWDVTEQRAAEGQMRQAQKMEAVGQLAGGIAHDFNNLLTAILGNLALILDDLAADDPHRVLLATAEKAAQRAANLTGQLLGFSRRTVLRTEALRLNAAVDEILGLLRRTIDPRVTLEERRAPDLWTVRADPGQMNQVLMNLCLNARDAMPDGGRLLLETENVTLSPDYARLHLEGRAGEFVRLRVSDTGHGIAPEVRARVFEPFFTTKGPGKGTGLGLAMVFGIIKQHRGWVDCYSEVGHGTRFDIYLPRAPAGEEAAPALRAGPPGRGHETILLADDEPMILGLGKTILQHHGYQVLLAEDGEEAVRVFEERRADIGLVVLDLTMPRLSGRDAFRRMMQIDPGVRVVFASGYSAEVLGDGERAQACGFVGKPYRPDDLARTVRAALDRATG